MTLDVVINGKEDKHPRLWVGGSCGNVITILAYFGWLSYPIAYIGKDLASKIILEDFRKWGVSTDFVFVDEKASTPIVIERINNSNRKSTHVFEFKCPYCGAVLPRSRPLPKRLEPEIIEKMPTAKVFYFDRTSRITLKFAKIQESRGALIVFEPHRISKRKLFKESVEIAHVVKYSADKISDIPFSRNIPLEIKTLGARGLKYRYDNSEGSTHKWRLMEAMRTSRVVDSAGAGDWCTAGIIHALGQDGSEKFSQATQEDIETALNFGQGLAASNCIYEGARGAMYSGNKNDPKSALRDLVVFRSFLEHFRKTVSKKKRRILSNSLCPSCARMGIKT